MSVLMLIHSLLNVLSTLQVASRSSEVNFTKNYTLLYPFFTQGHCAKLYKSRTVSVRDGNFLSNRVSLVFGIHYLMLFRHVSLRVLNVDCSLWMFHLSLLSFMCVFLCLVILHVFIVVHC